MSILKVNTIQDKGGNAIISSDGSGNLTPNSALATGVLANTPAFGAYITSNQSISSGANTKINFNGEAFDTDSAFDNSTNYRFTVPTGKGGKYLFFLTIQGNTETSFHVNFAINGGNTNLTRDYNFNYIASGAGVNIALLSLSAGDYVEGYCQQNSGSSQNINANRTRFAGYRIIGA